MKNVTEKALNNVEYQMKKLSVVNSVLKGLQNEIQWCHKYDADTSTYTDEIIDEEGYQANVAVFNDICKLYKIDC